MTRPRQAAASIQSLFTESDVVAADARKSTAQLPNCPTATLNYACNRSHVADARLSTPA